MVIYLISFLFRQNNKPPIILLKMNHTFMAMRIRNGKIWIVANNMDVGQSINICCYFSIVSGMYPFWLFLLSLYSPLSLIHLIRWW